MKLTPIRYAFVVVAMALAATACTTDDPSDKTNSCTEDTDCTAGFYCGADDKCVQDCDPAAATNSCGEAESCDSNGRCVVEGECVQDDDCDSPPTDASCDGDTLIGYNQVGTCANDGGETVCEYNETRTPCENGCLGGECLPDPCSEVVCNAPPAATCDTDGVTLVSFSDPGTCSEGVCEYMEVRMACAVGCQAGVCLTGTCDNEDCDTPPADECDENTAVRYSATGTCIDDDGTPFCDYDPEFENCDYTLATCNNAACENPATQAGGVIIVEYMANPAGSFNDLGEWFEVKNVSGATVDLDGWKIRSAGNSGDEEHVITGTLSIADGDSAVLVRTNSVSFSFDYEYDDISMANNTDWLSLVNPSDELVDYVFYEPGSILSGRSRKLDPSATQDAAANDDFANWCPSMTDEFETGPSNYGTPGADNTACAADPCTSFSCTPPDGFCIDSENKAVQYVGNNVMCEVSRFNNPFCDFDTQEVQCTDGSELCAFGNCETIPSNVPGEGELIFTEMMPNPASTDTDREWFEVYNTTGGDLSLFSVIFRDNEMAGSANEYQFLDPSATIASNEYVVFARNTDPTQNGGVSGALLYSGAHLKNDPDPAGANTPDTGMKLLLTQHDGTVIDEAYYDNPVNESSSFPSGDSLQLDPDSLTATGNDDAANWCFNDTDSYGAGGTGTPGAANAQCP